MEGAQLWFPPGRTTWLRRGPGEATDFEHLGSFRLGSLSLEIRLLANSLGDNNTNVSDFLFLVCFKLSFIQKLLHTYMGAQT